MNIQSFFEKLDTLLKESHLSEALSFMQESLKTAKEEGDIPSAISILNEMAGFFRDTGDHQSSIDSCKESERLLDEINEGPSPRRASAYLNTANAYRAALQYEDSFAYYEKAREIIFNNDIQSDSSLIAAYYNNIALLYQQKEDYISAKEALEKALDITENEMEDEVKTAISRTNLSTTLVRLGEIEKAKEIILPAKKILEGRTPSDFHYSATLSALGDIAFAEEKYDTAVTYYEMSLAEIELHMGRNEFYSLVEEHLSLAASKCEYSRKNYKGIQICEKYFNNFGLPVLKRNFKEYLNNISCGLFGEGSECLGFDDGLSTDHDFGPSFVIITKDLPEEVVNKLKEAYRNLPKTFMGYTREETAEAIGRVGVIPIEQYLIKSTGFDHIPKGEEWFGTRDEDLLLATNGKVFFDPSGFLWEIRKTIQGQQPEYVFFAKLSFQMELMAKHGQYAYPRALSREEYTTALIAKAEFLKAAMRAIHLLKRRYAPYEKWLRKSLDTIKGFEKEKALIDEITHNARQQDNIEKLCSLLAERLRRFGLIKTTENYLKVAATEINQLASKTKLADAIVGEEWAMFDKVQNEGGRANCQDDWDTFSIMRRSQYYVWPVELLESFYQLILTKKSNNQNIITEKYGYMMESTTPERFAEIKNELPPVSEDSMAIINAITQIQVGMMEDFAQRRPDVAANARAIHTSEDTPYNTSYETYLRGELETYDPETLARYGQFVVSEAQSGRNIAEDIMSLTLFFYGRE